MFLRLAGLGIAVWAAIVWLLLAGTTHDGLQLLFGALAIGGFTALTYRKESFLTLCGNLTTGITTIVAICMMGAYVIVGVAGVLVLLASLFVIACWGVSAFRKAILR